MSGAVIGEEGLVGIGRIAEIHAAHALDARAARSSGSQPQPGTRAVLFQGQPAFAGLGVATGAFLGLAFMHRAAEQIGVVSAHVDRDPFGIVVFNRIAVDRLDGPDVPVVDEVHPMARHVLALQTGGGRVGGQRGTLEPQLRPLRGCPVEVDLHVGHLARIDRFDVDLEFEIAFAVRCVGLVVVPLAVPSGLWVVVPHAVVVAVAVSGDKIAVRVERDPEPRAWVRAGIFVIVLLRGRDDAQQRDEQERRDCARN